MLRTRASLALALSALALHAPSARAQAPAVGDAAPDIRLDAWVNVEPGAEPTNETLRGKLVMLEFWGTWCAPCVAAMPHVQELHDRYGELGLAVLAISNEARATVEPFVRKHGYTFRFGCDPEMRVVRAFGIGRWPTTYLLGEDGRVLFVGDPSGVEPAIERALRLPADAAGSLNAFARWLARSDDADARTALERLIEQRPRAFDVARWARVAPRVGSPGTEAPNAPAPSTSTSVDELLDLYMRSTAAKDASGVDAALERLAASDEHAFDLVAWARASFRARWPLGTDELAEDLAAKRYSDVVEALLHRDPSPEAIAAATADPEFTAYCVRRAPDARSRAKKGLMLERWVFAGVAPQDGQTFWADLGVAGLARVDEHGVPEGVTIDSEFVTPASAPRFVAEELATSLALGALASGRDPKSVTSAPTVAAQREALLRTLQERYAANAGH